MSIDLNKGIFIKIEGEIGKYQSLPIDTLINIAQSLQDLINSIAKSDLSSDEAIDFNNFKIELTGFEKSSAVPEFSFTKRIQHTISDFSSQRDTINRRFSDLLAISDKSNYGILKELYPDGVRRNDIVDSLYNFANSFAGSPSAVVDCVNDNKYVPIYKIGKFKSSVRKNLITVIKDVTVDKTEEVGFGKVIRSVKGKKILNRVIEYYTSEEANLSHSPEVINLPDKQYILSSPLRCKLEKLEDYYVIQNEIIDIIGTGKTVDEAEIDFNEEFDYIYDRYTSLPNDKLSKRLQKIKQFLKFIVVKVEKN